MQSLPFLLLVSLWAGFLPGIDGTIDTKRAKVSNAPVSYVIEPFEQQDEGWFLEQGEVSISDIHLFGEKSLSIVTNATLGWILPTQPYNCYGAQHLSIWTRGARGRVKLTLYDDSNCLLDGALDCTDKTNLNAYVVIDADLETDVFRPGTEQDEWKEMLVTLSDYPQLVLNRLKGWEVDVQTSEDSPIFVDHLACLDETGKLFGSPFNAGVDYSKSEEENAWIVYAHNSNISSDESKFGYVPIGNETWTEVTYAVQMVEWWGGFLDTQHVAPGAAYFNISQATDLMYSYSVSRAADPTEVSLVRIILHDFSDCTENCNIGNNHERYYSFHSILDEETTEDQVNLVQLTASRISAQPFWLTGWNGVIGNEVFDLSHIKGYTLEVNAGENLGDYNVVRGAFRMSPLQAVQTEQVDIPADELTCVSEDGLYLFEGAPHFKRIEFLANQCCQLCEEDPECLLALENKRDCYLAGANSFNASEVGLLQTERELNVFTAYWMNTDEKRGSFCERCNCDVDTIDCRGYDLLLPPKSFSPPPSKPQFVPRVLDLRQNPRLFLLGRGALASLSETLEELWLPRGIKHIAQESLADLPNLKALYFEAGDSSANGNRASPLNAILDDSDAYGAKCCSRGDVLQVGGQTLTFCNMEVDAPGIDSVFEEFYYYPEAKVNVAILPDSEFLAEASESPEKCAEYCQILSDCHYFGYDARRPNSQHICYLFSDKGTPEKICCAPDHFADEERTLPGWTSGWPAQTRVVVDNARVLSSPKTLELTEGNNYEATLNLDLGSSPIRGGVWIEPKLSPESAFAEVIFTPRVAVLYDNETTATVNVRVEGVQEYNSTETLVFLADVTSCDAAFTLSPPEPLFIEVVIPPPPPPEIIVVDDGGISTALLVLLVVGAFLVVTGVIAGLCYWNVLTRKRNDSVWLVKKEELHFSKPPETLGRGTFGLVLLAEYRGTQVAVKRAIPPRKRAKGAKGKSSKGSGSGSGSRSGVRFGDGFTDEKSDLVDSTSGGNGGTANAGMQSASMSLQTTFHNEVADKSPKSSNSSWAALTMSGVKGRSLIKGKKSRANAKKSTQSDEAVWKKLKADFIEEMRYISKLRHPCITTVMGAVIEKNEEPMLIMEYMSYGSLSDLLQNETMEFEGSVLLGMLQDLSQGLRFLHSADPQVIHGDLKGANILVDSRLRAKVADFGLSQKRRMGAVGTPFWMAPELLRGDSENNSTTDIYSVGIIFYEVFSRKDPYEGEDASLVLKQIADPTINKRPQVPPHCPREIATLMEDCLQSEPGLRPTSTELDTRLKRIDAERMKTDGGITRSLKKNPTMSLNDVFPAHIAKALREGRRPEAEHHDMVTVFFSDIVGFTSIAATLEPRKVANLLDRLYFKLDALSNIHDVFKVETIGDAYMAVTNLVKDQERDHAKRIAQFAMEAIQAANETLIDVDNESMGFVDLRVGLHSGPVVSDVVGSRNPRYCLFGDTVNTAARMESNSKVNRIHCSKATAQLLKQQMPRLKIYSRGHIEIKGKGEMHTYWVNKIDASDVDAGYLASPNVAEKIDDVNSRKEMETITELQEQAPTSSIPSGEDTSEHHNSDGPTIPYGG